MAGHRVLDIRRRGKYLWWVLDDGDALLAHLGMSGQFRISVAGSAEAAGHPHLRVRFAFDDGGPDIDFLDQRTFGGMAFLPGQADLPDPISHIALDPLDPAYDLAATVARIRGKHTEIKRALLDQTVVSGIGNIYADESLWRAKVNYARSTASLTRPVVRRVLEAATEVMTEALAVGGTSFDALYVNVNGDSGLLRPLAGRLRAGGSSVPQMRHPDPAGRVHESVLVLLPALPAKAESAAMTVPAEPEPEVRLTAFVHGQVQGVGFRWWTRARALELGLSGSATNLP